MGKILILNNDLNIGGIQKSLIDFLEYLVGQGHKIDLLLWQKGGVLKDCIPSAVHIMEQEYAATWGGITEEKKFLKKIKLLTIYLKFNFYAKIIKKPWLFYPKIKEHYHKVVVYSENGYPRFYAIDNVSADKKYLWYHHGAYNYTGDSYNLNKEYYGRFNKIVTVSSANKKMLLEHFPEYSKKFFVVPNIINVKEVILKSKVNVLDFSNIEGVLNFVTVSRFSKPKGIDLAIDIATELKKQGLKFKWYFLGDGDTFLEIKKTIEQRSLEKECILLGNKKNPYPYMKLADLYIQTSYVESQSITIYEALALKKIIITSNLPVLNDALQYGKLGVLCTIDTKGFVDKINFILQNNSVKNKLEEAVSKHVVCNESTYQAINKLFE
ncbi:MULTISPECIES: glycosyltransferase [Flavobacteriaceae]|uniref:Glycosyltransferase n=2 Tax=Flavobacteriaceae TaxID=49546 RepID=A0A4Y8AV51_9FLAO|nr:MULTISPECIES: glycosyltransferase [Flavobacteriaceae]TEW75236.1 glycosyltransferase [Gramella jeungdoensis]GGK60416.1 hypothetical protein GCM10007963_30660 [Lutibacter litoralis]